LTGLPRPDRVVTTRSAIGKLLKNIKVIVAIGAVAIVAGLIGFFLPRFDDDQPQQDQADDCTYSRPKDSGHALKEQLTATATPGVGTINFGGARGVQFLDVTLDFSQPVPQSFLRRLVLDAPRRFYREGASLATVAIAPPTFVAPASHGHKRVTFTICVDGADVPSGSYTGIVSVFGPEGFEPLDLSVTVNARNADLFGVTLGVALFVSFLLLLLKGAADRHDETVRRFAQKSDEAIVESVRAHDANVLKDPAWWLATVVVLALGVVGAYAIYAQNPAWGDAPVSAIIAVAGAVLAPAGLRATVSGH
jgi:hypothetical protein